MTKTFPDGVVEMVMSGKSCPPDHTGQAGNVSTTWFRVDGGRWESASGRSFHKNWQALECADSVAEFRQLLEIL